MPLDKSKEEKSFAKQEKNKRKKFLLLFFVCIKKFLGIFLML